VNTVATFDAEIDTNELHASTAGVGNAPSEVIRDPRSTARSSEQLLAFGGASQEVQANLKSPFRKRSSSARRVTSG
jgi:hypothetical protein